MRYKETITGLLFIIILAGGIFSFFYFSLGDTIKESVKEFISEAEFDFLKNDSEEEKSVWSPGPLVREKRNDAGFLTAEGIIEQTNWERESFDRDPLTENEKLNDIAEIKLDDMFEKQYFAHISPSGEGVSDIAKNSTYEYLLIGDNLAMGSYRDDEDVVKAWMNSPGHRENILKERYTEIGVAAKKGEYENDEIWIAVQVFAMPTSACPEVDESLKQEIDNMEQEINSILERRDELQDEIDNIEEKGSALHVEKVEEYNSLGKKHDEVVISRNEIIDKYNRQVREKKECMQ